MAVAGINNNLFPPIIETAMPAFIYNEGIDIYFSISLYNSYNDIRKNAQITVRDQKNNLSVLNQTAYPAGIKICEVYENTDVQTDEKYYVHLDPEDLEYGFQVNHYYKVQIRFTDSGAPAPPTKTVDGIVTYPIATWINDNLSLFSQWSTVCLLRAISKPIIRLNGFELDSQQTTFTLGDVEVVGTVTFQDGDNQFLKSYRIKLYDYNENLLKDSGEIYANKYQGVNQIQYNYNYPFQQNITYYIDVIITTNNLYTNASNPDRHSFVITDIGYDTLDATISATTDKKNGRVGIHILGNTTEIFTGSLTIRRTSNKSNFLVWEDIHTENLSSGEALDYTWYDGTIESGIWYKYSAQKRNSRGHRGVSIELRNPIMMEFEDIYLSADGLQLNVTYNPEISQFSHTVLESRTQTIGSKYPFVKRNANVDYRIFPISGTITYLMSDENYPEQYSIQDAEIKEDFTSQNLMQASKEDLYGDYLSLYENYYDKNNIHKFNNYIYQHDFRQKVITFLYKNNVKLYRSSTEGNILVKLMDISFTPNRTLSRMIYDFSCTAVQIDQCSIQNYNKYGIQTLGDYNRQLGYDNVLLGQITRPELDEYSVDTQGNRTGNKAVNDREYFEANRANAIVNEDLGSESVLDKKYTKLVKELFRAKVGYLSYLKMQLSSKPYLIKIVNNTPVPLADNESSLDAVCSGYIVYINQQPTIINKEGFLEIKGEHTKITSLWFPEKVQGTIDYIAHIAQEEDLTKIPKMYAYIERIGQKWGHFFIEDSFYKYLNDRYTQNFTRTTENSGETTVYKQSLTAINGIRITAAPGTTVYVKESRDTGLQRHVIGDTGLLEFYDDYTNIEGLYFAGTHLEPADDQYSDNNVIPVDRFLQTGISANDFSEIERPVTNGVYWISDQVIVGTQGQGSEQSIEVGEEDVVQKQDSTYSVDKVTEIPSREKGYRNHNALAVPSSYITISKDNVFGIKGLVQINNDEYGIRITNIFDNNNKDIFPPRGLVLEYNPYVTPPGALTVDDDDVEINTDQDYILLGYMDVQGGLTIIGTYDNNPYDGEPERGVILGQAYKDSKPNQNRSLLAQRDFAKLIDSQRVKFTVNDLYQLILEQVINSTNRWIYYKGGWYPITDTNDVILPIEAIIDYKCEILRGRY